MRTAPFKRLKIQTVDILNSTDVQVSLEKLLLKQYEHEVPSGRGKEFVFLTPHKHSHDENLFLYPFKEFANCCSPTEESLVTMLLGRWVIGS